MLLKEDMVINDKYTVERFLGEGAFAEVYRVKHKILGRQALKLFKVPSVSLSEIEEALSEAVLLTKIGHPNIVRVYDASSLKTEIGECAYFTMEYIPSGSLDSYWRSFGNKLMTVSSVVDMIIQLCCGLAVAHSETPPIIHRDIKPHNILVGYDKDKIRVRLSDFGLAKRVNPLTLLASAHGTIGFKPPEYLENKDSCAGDIWAVGSVMYLLLTDKMPYKTIFSESEQHASVQWGEPFKKASYYNAQVDDYLDQVILKSLVYDYNKRHQSASELMNELQDWVENKLATASNEIPQQKVSSSVKASESEQVNIMSASLNEEVSKILLISQQSGSLELAITRMEQLLEEYPELADQYDYLLTLWKRGIVM